MFRLATAAATLPMLAVLGLLGIALAAPAVADPVAAPPERTTLQKIWPQYSGYPGVAREPAGLPPPSSDFDLFGPLGANLFGNTAGRVLRILPSQRHDETPMVPDAAAVPRSDHAARCAARYRSYDPASDTYVATSGTVRRCPE